MELPDDLQAMLEEMAKKHGLSGIIGLSKKTDYGSWVQVGKLTGPEILEHKNYQRWNGKAQMQDQLLKIKHERLEKEQEVRHRTFWNKLYESHSLPHGGSYHITPDNRILKDPNDKGDND
jgi:hypothetical protein